MTRSLFAAMTSVHSSPAAAPLSVLEAKYGEQPHVVGEKQEQQHADRDATAASKKLSLHPSAEQTVKDQQQQQQQRTSTAAISISPSHRYSSKLPPSSVTTGATAGVHTSTSGDPSGTVRLSSLPPLSPLINSRTERQKHRVRTVGLPSSPAKGDHGRTIVGYETAESRAENQRIADGQSKVKNQETIVTILENELNQVSRQSREKHAEAREAPADGAVIPEHPLIRSPVFVFCSAIGISALSRPFASFSLSTLCFRSSMPTTRTRTRATCTSSRAR